MKHRMTFVPRVRGKKLESERAILEALQGYQNDDERFGRVWTLKPMGGFDEFASYTLPVAMKDANVWDEEDRVIVLVPALPTAEQIVRSANSNANKDKGSLNLQQARAVIEDVMESKINNRKRVVLCGPRNGDWHLAALSARNPMLRVVEP